MLIRVICAGKLKERYYEEAINEFVKRLGRYTAVEIVEVADEKTPDSLSPAEERIAMEREGKRMLEKIADNDYVVPLCIGGKKYDSIRFSEHLQQLMNSGKSRITFVIGGSLGLSDEVIKRGNETLSLSDMTFPHRIARLLLLEQVYRSFKIQHHETYHK